MVLCVFPIISGSPGIEAGGEMAITQEHSLEKEKL